MHSIRALAGIALFAIVPVARAQEARDHDEHDDHDDHHHGLHFSHPLVTESPSPDTKLRADFLWTKLGDVGLTERGARVEGEYAFTPALSLAVTVPWVSRSSGLGDVSGIGNTEVSLKAASLRWGERGVLVGGGLSAGLPTGDDAKGIGTSTAIEVEPFGDVAYKAGALELVALGHLSTTVRNPAGAEVEHEVVFDGSALHPIASRLEALLELELSRASSAGVSTNAASIAPGVKVYPFRQRALMAGVSVPLGVSGAAKHTKGVLVSAFYHF